MAKRQKYPSLLSAQPAAQSFVKTYLSNTPLGLPELSETDFGATMDAIVKAMMAAWADGFVRARD